MCPNILEKLGLMKTETKVITIPNKSNIKDASISRYNVKFKSVSKKESKINNLVGGYLTNRLQGFFDFLTNPILLIIFICLSLLDFIMSNYNYLSLVLPFCLAIEWIVIKRTESKIANNLKDFSEEKVPKINFYGKIIGLMVFLYSLTAIIIIYYQFGSLIELIAN